MIADADPGDECDRDTQIERTAAMICRVFYDLLSKSITQPHEREPGVFMIMMPRAERFVLLRVIIGPPDEHDPGDEDRSEAFDLPLKLELAA